jgi:alkylhydroperoxidase/carboxymuconolactone decarboxylase family protein YurZ
MNASDGSDWTAGWERMLGGVPQLASDLREIAPAAEDGYRNLREWIYSDRAEGLPRSTKELIMVVINIAEGHPEGAVTHVKLGLANGLNHTQVREALAQCWLLLGLVRFNAGALAVWGALREAESGT